MDLKIRRIGFGCKMGINKFLKRFRFRFSLSVKFTRKLGISMNQRFIDQIIEVLGEEITGIQAVSGGDISEAFRIQTKKNDYFLKTNASNFASSLFQAEKDGLAAIAATQTIATPTIITQVNHEHFSYLLLEFIPSKRPSTKDFERLGQELAALYKIPQTEFGWEQDNFIGNLPQSNKKHSTWTDFYVQERLLPQLQLAVDKGLLSKQDCPSESTLFNNTQQLFSSITSSLIHGDLWSGNYLIHKNGTPYLIDPAVYVGDAEVDLAMSRLFGGFGSSFYDAYHEIIPRKDGMEERQDLYQLYYFLVHLNLFGRSYYSSVQGILRRYF